MRAQAGLDLTWQGEGERRPRVTARVLADRSEGVAAGRSALIASLHASWRMARDTELSFGVTHWQARRHAFGTSSAQSVQLALRTTFGASLRSTLTGGGAITGRVLREGGDDAGQPLADVEVVLDHARRTRTDAEGRYRFDAPGSGSHRVEALLPPEGGAYFTSASVQTVAAGGSAEFGVRIASARLYGQVRDDAGNPLAGVTVQVEGGGASAVTDSSGSYRLGVPEGEARVQVVAASVPAGYAVADLQAQEVRLARARPAQADFVLQARRTVAGELPKALVGLAVTVEVPALGLRVRPDAEGRFLLRGLPAGDVRLQVRAGDAVLREGSVRMPTGPAVVRWFRFSE